METTLYLVIKSLKTTTEISNYPYTYALNNPLIVIQIEKDGLNSYYSKNLLIALETLRLSKV